MLLDMLVIIALLPGALLAVPTLIYGVECLAGAKACRPRSYPAPKRPSVAVLVPAHNEERCILATLDCILPQLRSGDRLLVVADNCTDRTAELAAGAGAEVLQRHDPAHRGKGYALDAGVRHLAGAPCSCVMVVDADCNLDAGAVDRLVSIAAAEDRPVQGRNLMKAPAGAPIEIHVAEFAYLIKNLIRPRGMNRLGLPCQLMGTGMVIPWSMIRQANLAHGHIVEDMKLCLDLAQLGHAPVFCADFGITSYFPLSSRGIESQRRRWEGGHLEMIGVALDHLARPGSIRSLPALFLLLDRLVPPVTLLFLMLVAWTMLSAAAAPIVGIAPLSIAIASMACFVLSTFVVWFLHGREIIPLAVLAAVPRFIVGRLANYPKVLIGRREAQWVRTDRGE